MFVLILFLFLMMIIIMYGEMISEIMISRLIVVTFKTERKKTIAAWCIVKCVMSLPSEPQHQISVGKMMLFFFFYPVNWQWLEKVHRKYIKVSIALAFW